MGTNEMMAKPGEPAWLIALRKKVDECDAVFAQARAKLNSGLASDVAGAMALGHITWEALAYAAAELADFAEVLEDAVDADLALDLDGLLKKYGPTRVVGMVNRSDDALSARADLRAAATVCRWLQSWARSIHVGYDTVRRVGGER